MDNSQYMVMDQAKLAYLKACYEIAKKRGEEAFIFEGRTILTEYARYLVEYLKDGPLPRT